MTYEAIQSGTGRKKKKKNSPRQDRVSQPISGGLAVGVSQSAAAWQGVIANQDVGDVLPPAACDWLLTTEVEGDDLPPCLLLVLSAMLKCREAEEMGTRLRE